MKIKLFGCKDTTLFVAKFLRDLEIVIDLVTISPEQGDKNEVAGYLDLSSEKQMFNSIYMASSYSLSDKNDLNYFDKDNDLNIGICIGWQRLIPANILDKFSIGIFGMHGSARDLPYGKGRSPLNWSIIENRKWFNTNLFKYNKGVDSGPIIDKATFSINENDTAETLHYKNTLSMCRILEKNLNLLSEKKFNQINQDTSEGESFYPKRTPEDGAIDWRDDIYNIERLIRSVSYPFYGAYSFLKKNEVKIFRASIFYTDLEDHPFKDSKYGEIVSVFQNGKFLVRCSGGILLINDHNISNIEKGLVLSKIESPFSRFKRNTYGFFDV